MSAIIDDNLDELTACGWISHDRTSQTENERYFDFGCLENFSIGFIWVYALIDPVKSHIELDTALDPACDLVASMLRQMKGGSWVAVTRLSLQLEWSSRMKHSILVQVLEVSQARATSTHKPITHR